LNSALVEGEHSASLPSRFAPGEKLSVTHSIGGWTDPRAGLDEVERTKFLTLPGLELIPSVVQPLGSRYTDYAIRAVRRYKIKDNSHAINNKI
jgi:hypothetical protein